MLFILTSFDLSTVGPKANVFSKVDGVSMLSEAANVLSLASKGHDSYVFFGDRDTIIPFIEGVSTLGISIAYVVYRDGQILLPYDTYFSRFLTLSNMTDITSLSGEGDGITDPSSVGDYYSNLSNKIKHKSKDLWYNINQSSKPDEEVELQDSNDAFDEGEENVINT